ncbi:uncharacterized protein CDAR_243181 [Caerostris darwini]|uniref:Uncharacterized protein n=1 Tax=Caerostris darwini TaxID=1538125 RepID=A0AAV4MP32_9ARAC|nr:uncharacterized protein CDAR_243181 [Caerostris darwini]
MTNRNVFCTWRWFTSTASFLGLNYLCIELEGDVHYNVLWSAVAEVLGWVVAAILLKCTAPRRCANCVICAVGGVLCISLAIGRRGKSSSASLTLYVSTKLTVSISYFVFPLWTAEILPPGPRETALVLAEILNLACPVFLPLLIYQGRTQHLLPMTLLGLLHVVGGLMSLCLPETRLISFPQHARGGARRSVRGSLVCSQLRALPQFAQVSSSQ